MTAGISNDLGMDDYSYTIEDELGNRKNVIAHDKRELGNAIAEGSFYEVNKAEPLEEVADRRGRSERSDGEGIGGKFVQGVMGFVGFVVLMAVISMAAPKVGHFFEALFGFLFIAAIGWVIYRIVRRIAA